MPIWSPTDRRDWFTIHALRRRSEPFGHDSDPAEVAAWVEAVQVRTRFDIEFARKVGETQRRTRGNDRRCLVVDGPPGFGKTTLAMNFAIENSCSDDAQVRTDGWRAKPVAFVDIASTDGPKGLLVNVCKSLGFSHAGSENTVSTLLANKLADQQTRVLIVDDSHLMKRKSVSNTHIVDGLRNLLKLPATWVFILADDRYAALSRSSPYNNPKDGPDASYLAIDLRRSNMTLKPLTLTQDAAEIRLMVGRYLHQVRKMLPQLELSFMQQKGMLATLAAESAGLPGRMMLALKDATHEALATDNVVSIELLGACLRELSDG